MYNFIKTRMNITIEELEVINRDIKHILNKINFQETIRVRSIIKYPYPGSSYERIFKNRKYRLYYSKEELKLKIFLVKGNHLDLLVDDMLNSY